jgi:hypothetical protein
MAKRWSSAGRLLPEYRRRLSPGFGSRSTHFVQRPRVDEAARQIAYLLDAARAGGYSGVALKNRADEALLAQVRSELPSAMRL